MNLADLLLDHPFRNDEPLLHGVDRSWSAGEARAEAHTIAHRLGAMAIARGRAVAVELSHGPEVVTAMCGIWLAGCVFVPVNARLPAAARDRVLDQTRPAAVIGDDGIELGADGPVHDPGTAFVLWTSGTTGPPQAILHGHDEYLEIIDRVLRPLAQWRDPSRKPSPNLIPVSMALNAGIYNALFGLRAGASLVVMDRFTTKDFASLVARHQIRSTVLAPAAMAMLSDDRDVTDLTPLGYVRSITAPLSPFQARRFTEKFGVTVLNGYGQAEIGEVIGWSAADARAHPAKIGAIGRPHAGVSIRIDQPDGQGVGELLVKPPRPPAATVLSALGDRVTVDGHVRTGDIARVDAEGFVWIEGRIGDLINRGGHKVFPAEVEEVLASVPGVRDVAVVGRPDDRLGEVPVAYIVGDTGDADLDGACRDHLTAYKVPVRYERVAELPRNDAGKLMRTKLP